MQRYCTVTHGAYVLSKGSSMAWNFADSDPEFGVMQAKEVQFALQHVLSGMPTSERQRSAAAASQSKIVSGRGAAYSSKAASIT